MIVLNDVATPTEGIRHVQPQVTVFLNQNRFQDEEDGELYVTESAVTWISRKTHKGFSLTYPSIILHAISTDLSSFPDECIYILVDARRAVRPRQQRNIPIYTAAEAQHVQDLTVANHELNGGEEEDEEEDEDLNVSIRFVPADVSSLNAIYQQMCECQELNPPEEEGEEGDSDADEAIMEGGEDLMGEGNWVTADNIHDMESGDFELTEEGRANLMRMMGGGDHQHHNGHGDGNNEDEEMDG